VNAGRAHRGGNAYTFLFLADTQANRAAGRDDTNPRVVMCSQLNQALNALAAQNWPTGYGLTCEGQPIAPVGGLFFGGDICQTGGDYNWKDQMYYPPPKFDGGWELMIERHLYQRGFEGRDWSSSATRTDYAPAYFGLGNHDIQTEYHPVVGWFTGRWGWASPDDYWRFQMWNFICQMHTGVWLGDPVNGVLPVYPVDDIDANGHGDFWWQDRSFNYRVDLGPADVYQMHRYGGDGDYGRADGLAWLKDRLDEGGPTRPVIIVQHYPFSDWSAVIPHWTLDQRDALLQLLEPYNVIALLTGHIHDAAAFNQKVSRNGSTRVFSEFRPGSAGDHGWFALIRVSDTTMDVMFGDGSSGSVVWCKGGGFPLPAEPVWLENNDWNLNYFPGEGGLRAFYADTNELVIPPGRIATGFALRQKGGNRLALKLQHANPDGSDPVWLENNDWNLNYFPGEQGLTNIYADTNALICSPGTQIRGIALRRKGGELGNRLAPRVLAG
jgi:cytolysin (calcineurin-like family phosphatase)